MRTMIMACIDLHDPFIRRSQLGIIGGALPIREGRGVELNDRRG